MTDNTQSICLEGIRTKSRWVIADAADCAYYCKLLKTLPEFETEAEEAVEKALEALQEALGHIADAQAALLEKRVLNAAKEDA